MKKFFAFALLLGLVSCRMSGEHKPLMGVQPREEVTNDKGETTDGDATSDEALPEETPADAKAQLELPVSPQGLQEQIIKRSAYTLSYNKDMRNPNWVAWNLTAEHTNGPYKRNGLQFQEDEEVPTPRATNWDYTQSGYDRGHMCPSGDNKWSEDAQKESFMYSNCCPQLHNLNAGDWEELESQCRDWADEYGEVWIACGPVYMNKTHKTIGKNRVVVPEAFFKVVLVRGRNGYKAVGFIYRNEETNKPMSSYVNSVDQVERITGYDFFSALPDDIEKKVESEVEMP